MKILHFSVVALFSLTLIGCRKEAFNRLTQGSTIEQPAPIAPLGNDEGEITPPRNGTPDQDSVQTISAKGTVSYLGLEGGFYGITTDDGRHYDPTNLPEKFARDGLRVQFKAKRLENIFSIRMWGSMVEILEMEEIK